MECIRVVRSSPAAPWRRRFALVAILLLLALYAVTGSSMFRLPYFGLTLDPAGRVAGVDRDGPAAAAGLEIGDRIRSIGPKATDRMLFLTDRFYSGSLGTAPILEVERASGTEFIRL
jgi:S1-C subfamily serine protease